MKRVLLQILFSTIIFAAVLGIIFVVQKYVLKPNQDNTETTTASSVNSRLVMSNYEKNEVNRIAIQTKKGSGFQFSLVDDSIWSMNPPFDHLNMDQKQVDKLLTHLFAMEIAGEVASDYSIELLGLRETADLIILSFQDESNHDLLIKIGNQTKDQTAYYLQVGDQVPLMVKKDEINTLYLLIAMDSLTLQEN